jgi:cyclic beta-1,2-glucan synthetase
MSNTSTAERDPTPSPIPPSTPPLDEQLPAPPPTAESWEGLGIEASRAASSWKLSSKRKRCRTLEAVSRQVEHSILAAVTEIRKTSGGNGMTDDVRWLVENMRLLRSAWGETRHWLEAWQELPQAVSGPHDMMPRAYLAAAAFLRSTGYVFNDRAFDIFFSAAQESTAFETAELWALQSMMQLFLLEEIAKAATHLADAAQARSGGASSEPQPAAASMATLITSLRDVADADWKEFIEQLSLIERALLEDPAGSYGRMDFESRNLYREAIQEVTRRCKSSGLAIAKEAVGLARQAKTEWYSDPRLAERHSHVGYYLIDRGRPLLEARLQCKLPVSAQVREGIRRWPDTFYLLGIEFLTFAIMAFVLNGLGAHLPLFWAILLLLIPATESAIGAMNQLVSFLLPPRPLPKLDFSGGIPDECTTIVAVPTLLIEEQQVRQTVRDLELRYLGNRDPNLHFALLTDSPDSPQPPGERSALVALCSELIEELNRKYREVGAGSFYLFHRDPVFNPVEGTWMGWERKRGKLLDFNNLLRGTFDSFPIKVGDLSVLPKVRYVITLDADTQLPRDSARRLVATLAHPLNRAVIDPVTDTVVEGYGILQPRVGISVRSANRSRLASIYSGQAGFDIYTRAVSDVYQDLMDEGSFTGKGIYEVDVFQRVLFERFPLNAILSHDLIEGAYTRAGLVSDVEVIDDYPSHFSAYSRRKHRWVRGDWQIMRWLLPRVPDRSGELVKNPISVTSKWKILDNLRRSLVESATFVLLLAGWFFLPGGPAHWTVAVLALLLIPAYLRLLLTLSALLRAENRAGILSQGAEAFVADQVSVFMMLAFLAHQVLVSLDAIVRTVVRLTITRRRLLEWETAAESEVGVGRKTPVDLYLEIMPLVSTLIAACLIALRPSALPVAAPILVVWACAGLLSTWLNRPLRPGRSELTKADEEFLRIVALRTWRFFRSLSSEENHWLVPDNLQENPPSLAHRISPTNLGFLLNAQIAACELGYLNAIEFAAAVGKTLETLRRLPRCHGHFFNWYDTRSLLPLDPLFISTVDSGNLACCLWTLKHSCLQIAERPVFGANLWQGIRDQARLVLELARAMPAAPETASAVQELDSAMSHAGGGSVTADDLAGLERALAQVGAAFEGAVARKAEELRYWIEEAIARISSLAALTRDFAPDCSAEYRKLDALPELDLPGPAYDLALSALPEFCQNLERRVTDLSSHDGSANEIMLAAKSLAARAAGSARLARELVERLRFLAAESEALVREMDFGVLYRPDRKVLSVGYDAGRQRLEKSCYELLASEARIAAFVAIAKGDLPQESWIHLGRSITSCHGQRVLLSWSGTMFEYLMPLLWMKSYPNTILDQSVRSAVHCQRRAYKQIPWGVSECASSQKDAMGHYQYFAFGLRALAMRPRIYAGKVISPYSSFLALAVNTRAAVDNLREMEKLGWVGPYGFHEAADYSARPDPSPGDFELVRCWMAHHQGMILLSICNLLTGSAMQNYFHAEPMVAAAERLLHERLPRAVPVEKVEAEAAA